MKLSIFKRRLGISLSDPNGFSLVEALVSLLLFTIIAAGIYAAGYVGESNWHVNKAQIELQQELRIAMDWMIYEMRQAGDSSIVNVLANSTPYTSISYQIPTGVTAGSIDWDANTIQIILGGTGSKELQKIQGGVTRILAYNMQSLQFTRQTLTPNILEVSLVAQKSTVKGIPITYQLNFDIELRN